MFRFFAVAAAALALAAPAAQAVTLNDFAIYGAGGVVLTPGTQATGPVGSGAGMTVGGSSQVAGLYGVGALSAGTEVTVNGDVLFGGSIDFGGGGDVYGNVTTGGYYVGGTTIHTWGPQPAGNITAVGTVSLGGGTKVDGNVYAGGSVSTGTTVSIGGTVRTGGDLTLAGSVKIYSDIYLAGTLGPAIMPTTVKLYGTTYYGPVASPTVSVPGMVVPAVPSFSAGTTPVTVGSNTDDTPLVLAPGSYGDLNAGVYSGLSLTNGDYYFSSITCGSQLLLDLDLGGPPLRIFVDGDSNWGAAGMEVIVNGAAYGSWDNSLANQVMLISTGVVNVGDGQWFGLIYSDGDITFGKTARAVGAFYTQGVFSTGNHSVFTYVPPMETTNGTIPEPLTAAGLVLGLGVLGRTIRRRLPR